MTEKKPPIAPETFPGHQEARNYEGCFIVLEGMDGSGRSTQVALLKEWLEFEGFAVQTMGLRRSNLLSKNLDEVMAKNTVTRLTLALMYATDLFDQLENLILPALRAGSVVLADRYYYTLIARAAARGIDRDYLQGIYAPALAPDLTFFLSVSPEVAFEREFKKNQALSYWESGRDMNLSPDLHTSFITYQGLMQKEYALMDKQFNFETLDGEAPVPLVNRLLRTKISRELGIKSMRYKPSDALLHLWR